MRIKNKNSSNIKTIFEIISKMRIEDFEKSCYENVEDLLDEVLKRNSLKEKELILSKISEKSEENINKRRL